MRPPPAGLLIGLAILVVGCQGAAAGRPVPTGDDLVVGAAISLTGSRAGEGQLTQQGYLLWRDWMNERGGIEVGGVRHRVRLLVQDDESRAEQAAALADQLVRRRGARFLLGPYGSDATAAVAAVAERLGIPHVAGNGAALAIFSQGHRYTFGVLSPSDRYMTSVLDLAATLRPQPRTIAMLAADDSFSLEVAESVRAQASARGFQVVLDERYPAGSTAVAALVARAAALAPDILLNSGHLAEAVAIHRAARTLGLDARIFAYSVGPSTPDFVAELGPDADYVLVGSQWSPQVRYRPQRYLTRPSTSRPTSAPSGPSPTPPTRRPTPRPRRSRWSGRSRTPARPVPTRCATPSPASTS